jgi:hypothetical protein
MGYHQENWFVLFASLQGGSFCRVHEDPTEFYSVMFNFNIDFIIFLFTAGKFKEAVWPYKSREFFNCGCVGNKHTRSSHHGSGQGDPTILN